MLVNRLYLESFRNYTSAQAQFSDGVNVICGRNAQGKTNLLEAVYYLATGRSHRSAADKELIGFEADHASIRAEIVSHGREQVLEARFVRGRRRTLLANDVKLKKSSDLSQRLCAVMFSPDDLSMIKDGAAVRRKLMDQCLVQLRPGYAAALSEFGRLYEHKSRILRDYRERADLLDLLDDFNLRLMQESARIIYYRSAFSTLLSQKAAENHNEFSGGREQLTVRYKTVGGIDPAGKKPSELLPELLEHLRLRYDAELGSGQCLVGAHKDDLEIEINGSAARKFASQGQARTAAISLKLAERDIHFDDKGESPVLLLDDVLSELDEMRQDYIKSKIKQGQVFITCCDEKQASGGNTILWVDGGDLRASRDS